MARALALILACVLSASIGVDARRRQQELYAANPIRKVVTMLQDMQRKVTAEGEKELALFEKFMCYCKNNGGTLNTGIETAKAKIASLTESIEASTKSKEQTEMSLKSNQDSRAAAKADMAKATKLRESQNADFTKEESDLTTNLAALAKAIPAIEGGMSGAFLQTTEATTVRMLATEKAELPDNLRVELLSFLSQKAGSGYVPKSGEIVGILKTIEDEMKKALADATAAENEAQASYDGLMADKKKEVSVLSGQIETEQGRIGELGVEIATASNDLEDTKEALADDLGFLAELEAGCDKKQKEWDVIKATRADELVALADTIKVLNDDDALELFKKTLPGAGASLVQIANPKTAMRAAALGAIQTASQQAKGGQLSVRPELGLIAMVLSGKKIGFEKVIAMIDEMKANLAKEQEEDDSKKEYCNGMIDEAEDKAKALSLSISTSETSIDAMKGSIATLNEELDALAAGVKALDKSVAEATDIRKSENTDYKELMASNTNAKELLLWAKNRLNKFYDPKMYKPPPKRELSGEGRIVENFGGVVPTEAPGGIAGTGIGASFAQIHAHRQHKVAPPPPPETFGAYTKKTGQKNGVIAMIDLLIADLDKEMQEADVTEKDSQKEYEAMMASAQKKRAEDSKSITDKEAAKGSTEEMLQAETEKKAGSSKSLMKTSEYLKNLHLECDWLLKYFDVRKQARAGEVESLTKAKAVLHGASYSFLETSQTVKGGHLRASSA